MRSGRNSPIGKYETAFHTLVSSLKEKVGEVSSLSKGEATELKATRILANDRVLYNLAFFSAESKSVSTPESPTEG